MIQNQTRPVPTEDIDLILDYTNPERRGFYGAADSDRVAGAIRRVVGFAIDQPVVQGLTGTVEVDQVKAGLMMAASCARGGLNVSAAPAGVPWALIAIKLIELLMLLRR